MSISSISSLAKVQLIRIVSSLLMACLISLLFSNGLLFTFFIVIESGNAKSSGLEIFIGFLLLGLLYV
jgi:hypothetical protein